jgi:hypothetical protein
MKQIERCVQITEWKYQCSEGLNFWFFYHSNCHGAYAADALNVSRMNAKTRWETTNNEGNRDVLSNIQKVKETH